MKAPILLAWRTWRSCLTDNLQVTPPLQGRHLGSRSLVEYEKWTIHCLKFGVYDFYCDRLPRTRNHLRFDDFAIHLPHRVDLVPSSWPNSDAVQVHCPAHWAILNSYPQTNYTDWWGRYYTNCMGRDFQPTARNLTGATGTTNHDGAILVWLDSLDWPV